MDYLEMIKQLYAVDKLHGYEESEINFVKNHFNALPQVVENFWRKAGRTVAIHHVQDYWIEPKGFQELDWLRDSDYLILLNENQGVCRAGIRKTDLDKNDPPVYVNMDKNEWTLCTDTTSEFLKAALAYEAVFTFEYGPEDFIFWIEDEELEIIKSKLEEKPFMLHGWMDMDLSFYSNAPDNIVAIMDCDGDLQVIYGAASNESYQKLMEVMEGLGEN